MTFRGENQADNTADDSSLEPVNPYSSPVQTDEPDLQPNLSSAFHLPAPWEPGWLVVIPAAIVAGIAVVSLGLVLQSFVLNVIVLPLLAMFALAVLIKMLHKKTPVVLPIYGLLTLAFAGASYFLFIPVCMASVIPFALLVSNTGAASEFVSIIVFGIPVAITFLIFSSLLRMYLRSKHQNLAYYQRLLMSASEPPSTENSDPSTPRQVPLGSPSSRPKNPYT